MFLCDLLPLDPSVSVLSFGDRTTWSWCRQSAPHAGSAHQWCKNKSLTVCLAVPLERPCKHTGEDLRTSLPKFSSDCITSKPCDSLGPIISTPPPLSGKRGRYNCVPHRFVGIKESGHARHLEWCLAHSVGSPDVCCSYYYVTGDIWSHSGNREKLPSQNSITAVLPPCGVPFWSPGKPRWPGKQWQQQWGGRPSSGGEGAAGHDPV